MLRHYSTAVTPYDIEVVGFNPARYWPFFSSLSNLAMLRRCSTAVEQTVMVSILSESVRCNWFEGWLTCMGYQNASTKLYCLLVCVLRFVNVRCPMFIWWIQRGVSKYLMNEIWVQLISHMANEIWISFHQQMWISSDWELVSASSMKFELDISVCQQNEMTKLLSASYMDLG